MTEPAPRCHTCTRSPEAMNSHVAECSHVDCPHRTVCWADVASRPDGRTSPRIPLNPEHED